MNKLFNAIKSNDVRTENGMLAHSTSGSLVLDLFYRMGALRSSPGAVLEPFARAYDEDPLLAVRAMFYNRDIRGGQQERDTFRAMFYALCVDHPVTARKVVKFVPFYGRWDDLFVGLKTDVEPEIIALIREGLYAKNGLLAKWLPRESGSNGKLALYLAEKLDLTPGQYRRLCSRLSSTVETQMCENRWAEIDYNHVPSMANMKYMGAFWKHDGDRYGAWIENIGKVDVKTGKVNKINAGAIFPHDVLKPYFKNLYSQDENPTVDAMWANLPDFVAEGESFLPVIDVSGSMFEWETSRISGDLFAGHVAVGLGIYLAERNKSIFKGGMISFSTNPALVTLNKESLRQKVRSVVSSNSAMSTDLEAVFKLILKKAVEGGLSDEDMPKNIIILSDMQFNRCVQEDVNALQMVKNRYAEYGFKVPNVIFWNLADKSGVPAKVSSSGAGLVSGYSPSVMMGLLGGEASPMKVMLNVLNSERYGQITL